MTWVEGISDENLAMAGIVVVFCITLALLLEYFFPLEPKYPKMFQSDPTIKNKTREELIALAPRDPKLPLMTLEDLAKCSGRKGEKAYVACKGVVYDCSANEVYKSDGGYNCFAGKDATMALGTMLFERSGDSGWREKLNHEQLCVVAEWVCWYEQRYKKVAYLAEEYGDQ